MPSVTLHPPGTAVPGVELKGRRGGVVVVVPCRSGEVGVGVGVGVGGDTDMSRKGG